MTMNNLPQLGPGELEPAVDLVTVYHQKTGQEMKLQLSALAGNPPSGVSGAIQFSGGSAFASDAANLFWDDTNNRLGVGTNAPTSQLEIKGNLDASFQISGGSAGRRALFSYYNSPNVLEIDVSNILRIKNGSNYSIYTDSNGNVGLGTLSPTARTHIVGSGSTFATTSLLVQNSDGSNLLRVRDDGTVFFEGGGSLSSSGIIGTLYGLFGGASYEASVVLGAQSTSAGFLPPRMTTTQRDAITSPATGLKIYNTTLGTTDTYDGATWQRFGQQTLIKGAGSTSATTSLLVQNSAGSTALTVKDDLISSFAKGIEVIPSTNYGLNAGYVTQSANSFLVMREGSTTGYKIAIGTDGTGSTIFYNNQTNASFVSGEISLTIVGATKNVLIGTTTDVASSLMTLASTTKGFLPPRMTTTQKNAIATPAAGLVVYDNTTNKLCCYDGSSWNDLF